MRGIYILHNIILNILDTIKIGMSMDLRNRLFDYLKVFMNNIYLYCFKLDEELSRKEILYLEKTILEKTSHYRNNDLSTEYRTVSDNFTVEQYVRIICETLEEFEVKYEMLKNITFEMPTKEKEINDGDINREDELNNLIENPFTKSKREIYQNRYVDEIKFNLNKNKKALFKAPTGFGKTRVFFRLINEFAPKRVIILTPRKNLNEQTMKNKYTHILKEHYEMVIFRSSLTKEQQIITNKFNNYENIIIFCCYQSKEQLCEFILDNNIDLVIFDEAHMIQSWISRDDKYIKYLLDDSNIKYRLFATATPTEEQEQHEELFGKCIELVKIYQLINYGILCDIETIIKHLDPSDRNNYHDLSNMIFDSMIKYSKKKGLIFTNTQENAKKLHQLVTDEKYKCYGINSYLYISDTSEDELIGFENDKQQSIIITCRKIDYGYDNVLIDLVCFADIRRGDVDIRQTIGRGLRNNIEVYPNKILHVLLPIYMDEFDKTDYTPIKEYLEYIITEVGKDIIHVKNGNKGAIIGNKNKMISNTIYDGETIPMEIYEELCTTSYNQYSKFIRFLKANSVYDEQSYNELQSKTKWMKPFGKMLDKYKNFNFQQIHPLNKYFYLTKEECKNKVKFARIKLEKKYENNPEILDYMLESEIINEFNIINDKMPNMNIDYYYGINDSNS